MTRQEMRAEIVGALIGDVARCKNHMAVSVYAMCSLRYVCGLSLNVISGILGTERMRVRRCLARARRKAAEEIRRREDV